MDVDFSQKKKNFVDVDPSLVFSSLILTKYASIKLRVVVVPLFQVCGCGSFLVFLEFDFNKICVN